MSERNLHVACVQMRASDDVMGNIAAASGSIREAARAGAKFIATPENTNLMAADAGAQLDAKRRAVVEAFRRIAGLGEIFQNRQPVLVGADIRSTYCFLLSAEEQRDGDD